MRTAKDPDYKIDWESFAKIERDALQRGKTVKVSIRARKKV